MLKMEHIEELAAIVGKDNIATDRQDLLCYSYDATQMEFIPEAVVHPATTEGSPPLYGWQIAPVFRFFHGAPAADSPAAVCPRLVVSCWLPPA